jgi:predicted dehydrogenase
MKRRRFIKAVAAGSTLVGYRATGAEADLRRIRVGQVGTKHAHARGQMETLRKLDHLYEVVGVAEPDQQQQRRMRETSAYAGLKWLSEDDLLNSPGLQVVAVETEVRDLLATARRCVDAGLHIHLDKPAGESLPELESLHRTASEKSLTIQMGYMFRYNPAFRFLFQAARDGWLGQVFEVHGVMSKMVDAEARRELAEYRGGSMFELGCHLIDPLLYLLGPPDSVTPFNRRTRPEEDDLLDNMMAVFEYARCTATIRSAVIEVDGDRRRQFVACGDRGTIVIRPLEPPRLELTLAEPRGQFKRGIQTVELAPPPGRYHGAWIDLAKVIRGEKPHEFSHQHDLAVQRAILMASGYAELRS